MIILNDGDGRVSKFSFITAVAIRTSGSWITVRIESNEKHFEYGIMKVGDGHFRECDMCNDLLGLLTETFDTSRIQKFMDTYRVDQAILSSSERLKLETVCLALKDLYSCNTLLIS